MLVVNKLQVLNVRLLLFVTYFFFFFLLFTFLLFTFFIFFFLLNDLKFYLLRLFEICNCKYLMGNF